MFKSIINEFNAIVETMPYKTACIWFDANNHCRQYTFAEFNNLTRHLAKKLIDDLGLQPGDTVAALFRHDAGYILTAFACWRAGLIYTPLSLRWSTEKNRTRIIDTEANCLLTESSLTLLGDVEIPIFAVDDIYHLSNEACIHEDFPLSVDTVAMKYGSSGTTKKSKIISIFHEALFHRVNCIVDKMQITSEDVVLGLMDAGFDASLCEWLMAFLSGATLLFAPTGILENVAYELAEFLRAAPVKVTTAILLPSILKGITANGINPEDLYSIKKILTTGSAIKR